MSAEPNEIAIAEKVSPWPATARAIVITDAPTYSAAGEQLLAIKALRVEIGDTFDKPIADAHTLHKSLLAKKAKHEAPLAEAERIIKSTMAVWRDEQERARRAEEARRIAEQRKADEDKRLAEALELEAKGKAAAANAIINLPIVQTRVAKVESVVPKVAGVSFAKHYSAQCDDILELAAFVVANPQFREYLAPNDVALNTQARTLKEAMQIPGVRLVVK